MSKLAPNNRTKKQVYDLIMEGLDNRQIAQSICVTEKAVKWHKTLLFKENGVKSVGQLIVKHYKNLVNRLQSQIEKKEPKLPDLPTGIHLKKSDDLPFGLKFDKK